MPTQAQLTALAEEVYGTSINSSNPTYDLSWNEDKLKEMGFDTSDFLYIWSDQESHNKYAYLRSCDATYTDWGIWDRRTGKRLAVCIAD